MPDQVRLEQLEFARLTLHSLVGLLAREAPVLDHELADTSEVDRHERGHEPFGRHIAEARRNQQVVEDTRPKVVREVEAGHEIRQLVRRRQAVAAGRALAFRAQAELSAGLFCHRPGLDGKFEHTLVVVRAEHPPPRVGDGQGPGVELAEKPQSVHFEGRGVGVTLEAVGRHVVAAGDLEPSRGVVLGHAQQRPDNLAKHRPQVRPRIFRVVDLGAETALADREAAGQRSRGHPDVYAEPRHIRRPGVLSQVVADQVAADAEVPADRLANAMAVKGARHRIRDGVGDGAVVLVARVERRHEVVAALENRAGKQLDPFGHDRAEVRVDYNQSTDVQRGSHLEDSPQRRALATDSVHVWIGQADSVEPILGVDQEDLLDISRRLRLDHHSLRPIRRASVGVDQDRSKIWEVLHQPGVGSPNHVADCGRVSKARDTDHDVGVSEPSDLIPNGRCQHTRGHQCHRTTPPDRAATLGLNRSVGGRREGSADR